MFRKIVSNLPFSPALVGQLGFYARRLRKEELTRRIGLVFTVLALIVQSLAVFSPPEAANASGYRDYSSNSVVNGGAQTIEELQEKYNRGSPGDLHTIYDYYGMTNDVINLHTARVVLGKSWRNGDVTVDGNVVATGNTSLGRGNSSGSSPVNIGGTTYYSSPSQTVFLSNSIDTFVFLDGNGKFIGGIMLACGNPVAATPTYVPPKPCPYNPGIAENSADCKACPYNGNIWYNDSNCKAPAAACSSLAKSVIDRTHFKLTATATAENGASIQAYHFAVKDSTGKVAYATTINSNQSTATTPSFELTTTGKYAAVLSVDTSLGQKTSNACATTLEVVPQPVCPLNPSILANDKDCKPCEGDSGIWFKDKACAPSITQEKSAKNLSQGKDATTVTALPGDKIQYTITVKNSGKAPATQDIVDNLTDVLEYATVIDNGNGVFTVTAKTISWPNVTVEPGKSQTRTFMVQVASAIPTTNTGVANPGSYDCVMTNIFGNTTNISVQCPVAKVIVESVTQLPHTGPGENMLFAGILLSVVVFFYARSRQLGTEVRLIRRGVNAGTI